MDWRVLISNRWNCCFQMLVVVVAMFVVVAPSWGFQDDESKGPIASANSDKAAEKTASEKDLEESLKELLEGHSAHGEAFNEGPRQQAYLMGGTGNVRFSVTTDSKEAQAFIEQGIGQLHGFWYLEAERSFRQAAALDENCAMAYWGAAMAAYTKRKRSQGFIKKAVELKDSATDREKMYIDALDKYFSDAEKSKTKRAQNYLKDLESIVIKYPDDLEAKAFVAHRIWHNGREGTPVSSYVALDSLINKSSRKNRFIRLIITPFTCGIIDIPRTRFERQPVAAFRPRASLTCGTCPVIFTRG